jgi:hypothetical protein
MKIEEEVSTLTTLVARCYGLERLALFGTSFQLLGLGCDRAKLMFEGACSACTVES